MYSKYRSISDLILHEQAFSKLRAVANQYEVVEHFDHIFPELVKVVEPVKVEKKILFLRVANSVWRSELNFRQKMMVQKINKHFDNEVINSIKFIS